MLEIERTVEERVDQMRRRRRGRYICDGCRLTGYRMEGRSVEDGETISSIKYVRGLMIAAIADLPLR
jgi:hypothetical protein